MYQSGVRFNHKSGKEFHSTLKKRVNAYFKENNISKHGNWNMYVKTVVMCLKFYVPYAILVSGVIDSHAIMFLLAIVMGFGMAGIGLTVMHDANHGAYSGKRWVNNVMSYLLNGVGGNSLNWKLQHNVLHHSFTNIEGHDEDIDSYPLMRFSPHNKVLKHHKFQFIYAWFLYGLMTFSWILFKDFVQLVRFKKMGLIETMNTTWTRALTVLIITKTIYLIAMLIPLFVLDINVGQWFVGFFSMHFVAGLWLAAIFQPAHVVPETTFPLPEDGTIENNFAIHQMNTTANFAMGSRIFSWMVGGLNYQVEHHLFPNICHVHYRKISKIVKATANEYNIPYHAQPTFAHAIYKHTIMLKKLGAKDAPVEAVAA